MLGGPTITTPGTCVASGGALEAAAPWKQRASFCPMKSSGGCASGGDCVPLGSGAYADRVCIYLPGEQPCPTDFPSRTVVYQKSLDQRTCSPCSCAPGALSCTAEYEFFDDGLCLFGSKSFSSSTCTNLSGAINDFWLGWSYKRSKAPSLSGGCVAGGGLPGGQFAGDPNTALSVCCRPAG
jgi:hypothetical protein